MLEGLVAWVLNNYLGKYVENLNTDQLSIALLSGEVELENLPLKKDALRHLGLPITINSGFIGKIKLEIPVRQIRSAPWVIVIEQLYVVASPLPVQEWDPLVEEAAAQELKLSALDAIEARWRLETDTKTNSNYYASTYFSWLNVGSGLITDIIENLQLKIRDVHLRYEDSDEMVGFGITMEYLSVQSCDSNWLPGFLHCSSLVESFKLLEMNKLAIYWMTLDTLQLFSKLSFADLASAMCPGQNNDYNYILPPVSAQARFKRNRSEHPLRSNDTPRIVCDLHLQEVPLTLVDRQYEQMVNCARRLEDISRLRSFRHYRPPCTVKEDARAWWLYAISCQYPDRQPAICKPRPTWESCLERAKENSQYVELYKKVLATPGITLPFESKRIKDAVEWSRSYEELKVLREIAMRTVPVQNQNASEGSSTGRSILVSWFPQWMGWYSSAPSDSGNNNVDTSQLEGEIFEALTDSAENSSLLKRDTIFGQFNFSLKSGAINLSTARENSNACVPMLELQFKDLSLNIVSRPRTSSYLIELSLGALYLHDKLTPNTLFSVLVGPPGQERLGHLTKSRGFNAKIVSNKNVDDSMDSLFYLAYEQKPDNSIFDYRLRVRSKSLDVVYQPAAMKWLSEFLCLPHQRAITQKRIEAVKLRTKKELIKNWEQILDGHAGARKNWELHLDISAPQIIFVEQFTNPNSAMAVIDFGRLQLQNFQEKSQMVVANTTFVNKEHDEDDMFMTPCSTPPGSEASHSESLYSSTIPITMNELNQQNLHRKLYDCYCVELTDLQVLIGRVRDNWRYAHNRGSSTLHILDRFNISLQIEHRIVHTCDPLYPSLTVSANLPKLVAHINEQKIAAARGLIEVIKVTGLPSPFNTPENDVHDSLGVLASDDDDSVSMDTSIEMSRLLLFQFTVDHLALEVQSRGRSIVELQVAGVKASFSKRLVDVNITLSVHSLLLVDALQTFGPDFELLVASHKHVGMDSVSGSLRDSEPTSPTSPGSPDPSVPQQSSTSPVVLTQALSVLSSSPTRANFMQAPTLDAEALITIEVILVNGFEPMHIANIQFNNLDIIANQETIVELIGFAQRVFPELKRQRQTTYNPIPSSGRTTGMGDYIEQGNETPTPKVCRTELTFDFHRLNVLLLRGVMKDDSIFGRKIATATMSEAKIRATVDEGVVVEGSLGGLQVLDLTPEGHLHQRIISVGHDPVLETPHPLYIMSQQVLQEGNERKAFSFRVDRKLGAIDSSNDVAIVTIRMASVWYTHSPQFLMEVQTCATEFKQYFANLARSIRTAATDMALGLVNARAEALAQSLYMNSRLSASLYGSALSFSDIMSPRKRSRHGSFTDHGESLSGYSSVRDTVSQTPYSPLDDDNFVIDMKLDIVLDSPVLVLPRASNSPQVFVANLGKTTVSNHDNKPNENYGEQINSRLEHYSMEIRDMNLFSLDTSSRRVPGPMFNKSESLYCCATLAKPILHNTVVQLTVEREIQCNPQSRHHSLSNLLGNDDEKQSVEESDMLNEESITVSGSVITALKLSLTRLQYEQLLDTFQWLTNTPKMSAVHTATHSILRGASNLHDISEEDTTGVTTLNMDPHVRAKLFPTVSSGKTKNISKKNIALKVLFELPVFTIELRGDSPMGEQGFVDLSFQEFVFNYERYHRYETNIQVSLRSVIMEDLLQPQESRQRTMVISSFDNNPPTNSNCISRSCPNIHSHYPMSGPIHGSLPDHLELPPILGMNVPIAKHKCIYPSTPPPSPSLKERPQPNLVLISSLLVDASAPNFQTYYSSVQRSTSIDFNCLDLMISVESWVVVIDFFSAGPSQTIVSENAKSLVSHSNEDGENTETNITVRSLTMTMLRLDRDIAKANISHVDISIKSKNLHKEIEGRLGSMSLLDLTLQGQLYKERFLTSGKQALHFVYISYKTDQISNHDAQLKLEMSSVFYVHTKRFIVELQAIFNHFTQLQSAIQGIGAAATANEQKIKNKSKRLAIIIRAGAPVIFLPVSSRSCDVLVSDLGQLSVTNSFKYSGDLDTISVVNPSATDKRCLLDVLHIDLQNVDLYSGVRDVDYSSPQANSNHDNGSFKFETFTVNKVGPSLLTEKCHLQIQVERNLNSLMYHSVPDLSMHGKLSTLDVTLDLKQYQLIRNLLTYNLGENTEHILSSVPLSFPMMSEASAREVWTLSSFKFDLSNVILRLQIQRNTLPLARINFIKSRLTVESFSNLSQDVDLVSQEILVMDTRFQDAPANKRSNVFTNILQPMNFASNKEVVQAEIHSRKRQDRTKFTILLNNMRLMAVFDWWEATRKFILEDAPETPTTVQFEKANERFHETTVPFELKLNITDSEIIVVEDTSQWDTNAVIFKSTTVLSYKPYVTDKPLSCNLNNCEMYSCILGMEEETALSIIDPVMLNLEISKERVLEVQLQLCTIRLSYHDMRLFLQILNSLPKQMFGRKSEMASTQTFHIKSKITKLTALGFRSNDCMTALELCEQRLEDAALWLTQNAVPSFSYTSTNNRSTPPPSPLSITAVEVKADCIFLCVIDDCGDADVPLLEISLAQLNLRQRIGQFEPSDESGVPVEGALECKLSSDYYNRILSGWEPIIEQWKCVVVWDHLLTSSLTRNRLQLNIESQETLNINVTSFLLDLYQQVRDSWIQDYYTSQDKNNVDSPPGYRRRSPFVPFALKNESGLPLYFTTLISDMDLAFHSEQSVEVTDRWVLVAPNETVPFSFRSHDKRRHGDSHRLRMHQLGVKVEGWKPITPVTVDKVGTFFRHASTEIPHRVSQQIQFARIVFDVSLEGSARKLVTVRSALVIENKLLENIEIKLENYNEPASVPLHWNTNCQIVTLVSDEAFSVPLMHVHSHISVRPISSGHVYTYCNPNINWSQVTRSTDCIYEVRLCQAPRDALTYRFCAEIKKENYHAELIMGITNQPAHTITLLPTILLINLLPTDLNYNVAGGSGQVVPGSKILITHVDAEQVIELRLCIENFPVSSPLIVPAGCIANFSFRVRFEDSTGRRLFLQAFVVPFSDARIKITISAPYWIINKIGIPLVFRQRGVSAETAGQFEEHEIARMVAPLLFSFSDPDASPSVVARVGTAVVPQGNSQWCQDFDLQRGIKVRKLTITLRDGRPDVAFLIGIEVRTGRGRYRHTNIVTISPRFQLHNKSSYQLLFSQSCFATTVADPLAETTYLKVVSDCYIPFHWRRFDKDQLLCVLIQDIPDCCWSGGFKIDRNDSMHLNIRDINFRMYFLRVEIVLQGATYFVVFTDADRMPPPIRVDNFSEVPITFAQSSVKHITRSIARAHTSVPYAWDQPTGPCALNIVAPGGVSNTYDMNKLGTSTGLTYENFIYVAFSGTFKREDDIFDPLDVESQQLVLDVVNGTQVVLGHKQPGQRSQLWRMTTTGQLQHEGSSPPSHPQHPRSDNTLVLDIEGPAPQPMSYTRLMLRRLDPRRRSTQTWRFTEDGRLCCAHYNMCVQAQDGFFGLRQGNRSSVVSWQQWNAAVLGLPQPICHRMTNTGIPIEQAVCRQRLRPGSGFLSVEAQTDGPTRVLIIRDIKEQHLYATSDEKDWGSIALKQRPNLLGARSSDVDEFKEMQFTLRLAGLGVSLVSRQPCEEILFGRFATIVCEVILTTCAKTFCISVKEVQCDNQLFDTPVPVVLYVTPPGSRGVDEIYHKLPTLEITAEIQPTPNENAVIFKHLMVRLKKLTINLEEKLLLKMCAFFKAGSKEEELWNNMDESDFEAQRLLTEVSAAHAKRYYFGVVKLIPDQIKLSMKTVNKLSPHLQIVKRKLGFTFIKFEDAHVELQPFVREHLFETGQILSHSIVKHFKDELVWQAGIILGSTDFLGNPLGFMNDVSEGVSGLIYDGSVGALVKNVTHGLSNSAAKVTESLSDGLGRVAMDDEHEEMRQRIRQVESGKSGDHIVAGIKGLGFGILGGATGIFKQVYEGATNEGIQGVFSGFGKGLVGAVTKPVVGVLDLASETARAVRDSSRSSNRIVPERMRPPRCVVGTGGLLTRYSHKQSQGQQYLYMVNNRNYSEQLVAYESLRSGGEDLRIIVSSERVRVVTGTKGHSMTIVIETHLSDLLQCQPVTLTEGSEIRHYIEITMRVAGTVSLVYQDPVKKPRIRCDSMELAHAVSQQLGYAKRLYNDRLHTLQSDNITQIED